MSNRFTPVPFYKLILLLTDLLGFFVSFQLAYYFRLGQTLPVGLSLQLVPCALLTLMLMYIFDVYKLEDRFDFVRDLLRLFLAIAISGSLTVLGAYLTGLKGFSGITGRGVFVGAMVAFSGWSAIWRFLLVLRVRKLQKKTRWLVIGTRDYLQQFLCDYDKSIHGAQLVCLTQSPIEVARTSGLESKNQPLLGEKENGGALVLPESHAVHIKGTWDEADDWLEQDWRGIIIATGQKIPEVLVGKLMQTRFRGTRIYDLSDFYEMVWRKVPIFYLQGSWFALSQGFHLLHNPIGLRLKRVGDILCAGTLLLLAAPLIFLAGMMVWVTSGRPIIYTQRRKGLNGEEFTIYKFRSMKNDAERDGAQWAQAGDSRVTLWGKWMRLSRIDELPQIWNILKGDMSFIGPRPERPEFTTELSAQIPFYDFRHLVRPGLSGWAQVMYPYGATIEDAKEKLQFELFYIKNYSLFLDWLVLLKTARVVLLGQGR